MKVIVACRFKYPNFVEDIPVIIQNVSFADDFDGSLQSRRTIIYTLEFEMKISYYGPLEAEGAIIREVNADLFFNTADLTDSDKRVERLSVTPDPLNVNPDSDYGFNTTIT